MDHGRLRRDISRFGLPDIRFIEDENIDLKAIVITHSHEDHYGALADLWPYLNVPVYVSPFTAGMLEAKRAYERSGDAVPVKIFRAGETFQAGVFSVEAVPVNHSIPEPVSLAITTPAGVVIHTGDWKIDVAPTLGPLTDESRFRQIGDAGVLALICDSTNALMEGSSPSEKEVSKSLEKIISAAKGRVALTTFSSNVGRIRSIAEAARDAGRQVLLLGSSIKRVVNVATDLGMMEGLPPFIEEDEYGYIPRDKIVIILTGSQGESRAALAKLSRDEMRNVHVSGHPRRNELVQMYEWVRPEILVPVHGEAAHLTAHAKLGLQSGIKTVPRVRNGDMLRLSPGPVEVIAEVPHGRIYKDGDLIGDFDEMGIGERRKLSYAGHIAVNVLLNSKNELIRDPSVSAFGLPQEDENGALMKDCLVEAAINAVGSIPKGRRKDLDVVRESVRRAVRSAARNVWGKKPVMTVFLTRI